MEDYLSYENLSLVLAALEMHLNGEHKMNLRVLVVRVMQDIDNDPELEHVSMNDKNIIDMNTALEFYSQA